MPRWRSQPQYFASLESKIMLVCGAKLNSTLQASAYDAHETIDVFGIDGDLWGVRCKVLVCLANVIGMASVLILGTLSYVQ